MTLSSLGVFRIWLSARVLANLGGQIQLAALGWAVYGSREDPLDLAWLGLSQFLPVLLFALPAGAVVDRSDRRVVLGLAAAGQGLVSLIAAGLSASGLLSGGSIVALGLLMGTMRIFSGPASQALLPALVPAELLPKALAASSMSFQLSTILGPSLAGLFIGAGLGAHGALFAASCAQICAGLAASRLPSRTLPSGASRWEDLLAGLEYIRKTRVLLAILSLDLFAVLFGSATALLPAFARVLSVGPEGFGMLRSAPAVGALLMALWLARSPVRRQAGPKMLVAVAVFGLATLSFALSTSFPLSLLSLAVLGAADMVSVVIRQTLVQIQTPDALRGRVSAVNFVFIGASNELGDFESGIAARLLGPVGAVVVGSAATLGIALCWSLAFPELRRADRIDEVVR